MAFKGSPSSQHQHCTDEAQKAETVLSAVSYIYIYIYIYQSILWQLPFLKNYQNHSMDLSAMGHCHSDFEVFCRSSLLISTFSYTKGALAEL